VRLRAFEGEGCDQAWHVADRDDVVVRCEGHRDALRIELGVAKADELTVLSARSASTRPEGQAVKRNVVGPHRVESGYGVSVGKPLLDWQLLDLEAAVRGEAEQLLPAFRRCADQNQNALLSTPRQPRSAA
jgi:hypothetical protein